MVGWLIIKIDGKNNATWIIDWLDRRLLFTYVYLFLFTFLLTFLFTFLFTFLLTYFFVYFFTHLHTSDLLDYYFHYPLTYLLFIYVLTYILTYFLTELFTSFFTNLLIYFRPGHLFVFSFNSFYINLIKLGLLYWTSLPYFTSPYFFYFSLSLILA